jgi:DNA-directed RNA polymerase alpha subunit
VYSSSDSSDSTNTLPRLAAPARRALENAAIADLDQLSHFTERDITDLHGMGKNALSRLREALAAAGLSFRDEAPSDVRSP